MQLSPENLWEDGMLSPAQARKKEALLMRKLSVLFKELGYEVDEYDIMTEIRNASRMASSHTTPSVEDMVNGLLKTLYRASFSFKGKKYPVFGAAGHISTIEVERGAKFSFFNIFVGRLELSLFGEWRMGMGGDYKRSTLSPEERQEFGESLGKGLVAAFEAKFPGICDFMGGKPYLIKEVGLMEKSLGWGSSGSYGATWAISHEELQKYIASRYA